MGLVPIYNPTEIVGQFVVDPHRQNWSHSGGPRRTQDERQAAPIHGSDPMARDRRKPAGAIAMNAQELLQEISDYCRQTGLAESTFGRRAVNDGKLASRLRHGGRITTETLDRIRNFMSSNANLATRPTVIPRTIDRSAEAIAAPAVMTSATPAVAAPRPTPAVSMPMAPPRG